MRGAIVALAAIIAAFDLLHAVDQSLDPGIWDYAFDTLDHWQTLFGALLGGGAAILAGRYALSAVRLQIDTARRLRYVEQAEADVGSLSILAAHIYEIFLALHEISSNYRYRRVDETGSPIPATFERMKLNAARITQHARDMRTYMLLGGGHVGPISSSIVGIETSAIRMVEAIEAFTMGIQRDDDGEVGGRELRTRAYFAAMSLERLASAAVKRTITVCGITNTPQTEFATLNFVATHTKQMIEQFRPAHLKDP